MYKTLLILVIGYMLSGCQTASVAVDKASAIRQGVAKKEAETHRRGLCAANFDVIRQMFGKNEQDWNAILTICESGQNSVLREAK